MLEDIFEKVKPSLDKLPVVRTWSEEDAATRFHRLQLFRLRNDGIARKLLPGGRRVRIAATACWDFPIYSQSFVYQELSQLIHHRFDLRFLYSSLKPREHLAEQFSALWPAKRKMIFHHRVHERDYDYFASRMPEKIAGLVEVICRATGIPETELRGHHHFQQSFTFTRMVEAYGPDYLHSYFFYEGTFFTFVASYLLDIPRGVSCYADHVLDDYPLKMVPLHLSQCAIVIATSHRIKRELLGIAPEADPERIVVKPNAINAARFPVLERKEPAPDEPFRLISINRIEPKKGMIYLVDAIRLLRDRKIDVHAHVLGGVDSNEAMQKYANQVEERIQRLGLGEFMHLEGRKSENEIRGFLAQSHLFLAPFIETDSGDKDGIPTALLEAMATGIPAIATDAGSITEVIEHGRDGIVVAQRDPEALANAIEQALRDPAWRRETGKRGAQKIRRELDVSVCETRFHRRIREVIRRPAGYQPLNGSGS